MDVIFIQCSKERECHNYEKKAFFECIIMILGAIVIFVISTHDAFLYKQTILQVTEVSQGKTFKTSDEYGNHDKKTNQRVDGLILNGEKKGKNLVFKIHMLLQED